MNAISFASAYRQLAPAQKAYVDAYVTNAEREATRRHERISLTLHRPISEAEYEASRGMLDNAVVRAAIAERINQIAADSELSVHRVIKELMAMAFSNIDDYQETDAMGERYFDFAKCTPEQMSAVKAYKIDQNGDGFSRPTRKKVEVVLYDKQAALKMLGDYMGMLNPDNPFWRMEQARNVTEAPRLPSHMSVEAAGDLYAAMIND